jgi:hypothetical protein
MDGTCGGCGNHCVLRQLPVINNFGGLRSHPNRATLTRRSAQRIVLYAKDRGCSHPGCDVAGYWCEAHHCTPYAQCHTTDVNDLTFGCGGHHPLAEQGWTTRKNQRGDTEWIPPPHLDHDRPRTNTFHHPEKLLRDDDHP